MDNSKQVPQLKTRRTAKTNTTTRTRPLVWLLATLLLVGHQVGQTRASLFILGGACVAALDIVGGQLEQVEDSVEVVRNFCRTMQRDSIEGVLLYDVLPGITRLARVAATGRLTGNTAGLADLIDDLAERIRLSGNVSGGGGNDDDDG